eukprot:3564640-Rhodomonas_salina.1
MTTRKIPKEGVEYNNCGATSDQCTISVQRHSMKMKATINAPKYGPQKAATTSTSGWGPPLEVSLF